jgi:MOSC domain-containing protein YiiM
MSEIFSIVYTPANVERHPLDFYARVPLQEATLTVKYGIEGDLKGKQPDRQLNVMTYETLQQLGGEGFQTAPGQMGEQLTLKGLDVNALNEGDQIQLGDAARIEVIKARTGCDRFEHIQGKSPELVQGRMGVMAKVLAGGVIRVGDPVKVLQKENV